MKHLLFLLFLFLVSCKKKEKLFSEISPLKSNIEFSNDLNENDKFNLVEYLYFYNGGGVTTGDINNDGLIDIYISSNQGLNKLYLNKGDFIFEDITKKAGVQSEGEWKTGVSMVDINGDGLLDLLMNISGSVLGSIIGYFLSK